MNHLPIFETEEEYDESLSKDLTRKEENSLRKCITS